MCDKISIRYFSHIRTVIDENGNKIDYEELQGSTGNEKIFDTTKNTNNPFSSNSIFDENRRVTIKHTIQTTLSAAIGSYNEFFKVRSQFKARRERLYKQLDMNLHFLY